MSILTNILSHLGLTTAHADLATAAIKTAPAINPDAPHEDWHLIAVHKFKELAKALFNEDVQHYAANALIGILFGQFRAQASATLTPVINAAEQAAKDAADTAIAKGQAQPSTPGKPSRSAMQAVIATPTSLRPTAPRSAPTTDRA